MKLKVVNALIEKDWREFIDQNPGSNIFHTPEMFHVFQRTKGYQPQLWASLGENGEILAILPLVKVTLYGGFLRILTTRAISYGGVSSVLNATGKEGMEALLNIYTKKAANQALFTELRHLSDSSEIRPILDQYGFKYEDHLDYLIDLNGLPEQVFINIGSRTRKHIRKGLRKGKVIVEELTYKEQLKDWYNLIHKTYISAQVPITDLSLFEAAFDILYPRGMAKFWLARIESAYIAASVELLYKDMIYGWYGGVDRAYANETPGELLMWHILKWGAENGYHIYDFGGAGKPGEDYGVRDFKAKFGGNLVCYGRNTFVPNPILLRISTLGYEIYRKLL